RFGGARARQWWDECLSGPEGVGLAWAAVLGFIRLTTNRRVVVRPLPVHDVTTRIGSWLEVPHVDLGQRSGMHFPPLRARLERLGPAGNQLPAAPWAVRALERAYILYPVHTDFARFPGLRWDQPCAG